MITHYLNFISSGHGRKQIDEPEGFDKAGFVVKQDSNRYGRDISYASGESTFRIYRNGQNEYYFEIVDYNFEIIGSDAIIKYEIQFDDEIFVIGELDLGETYKTDKVTYIEFNCVEESFVALFKKRFEATVDEFSTTTIDDAPIEPVDTYKMLYKAVPVIRLSNWTTPPNNNNVSTSVVGLGGTGSNIVKFFNYANLVDNDNIRNTLSYLQGEGTAKQFGYVQFTENSYNVKIKISNVNVTLQGTGNGEGVVSLRYYIGDDTTITNNNSISIFNIRVVDNAFDEIVDGSYEFDIPFIERTQKIYFFIRTTATVATNLDTFAIVTTQVSTDVDITVTQKAYNTVIPVTRLIDNMRYTVKSLTGNNIDAPRWDAGGEFYNQFITTTNLMRNILDKPFNLTAKQITEKYLPEVNGDYEVKKNGDIFFGIYRDFYTDIEIGRFDQTLSEFTLTKNPLYNSNLLSWGYENYLSQKEEDKENTQDIVHGDSQWLYPAMKAQNKVEVKIGFIRDPYYTNDSRIKAYTVDQTTATQDDNKIFIIDGIPSQEIIYFTETTFIQHTVSDNYLILRNQGEIRWELLGIQAGSTFQILSGANIGTYVVNEINGNSITLYNSNSVSLVSNDGVNTRYKYQILSVDLVNRTDEGFTLIEGVNNSEDFGNLKYTVKRNILKYWNEFNATMCLKTTKPIKKLLYNNNPDLRTVYEDGSDVKEGDSFYPTNPILTQNQAVLVLDCSLKEWFAIEERLRSQRGYITVITPEGLEFKGYIKDSEWTAQTADKDDMADYYGSAKITLEEKYSLELLNIFGTKENLIVNGNEASGYTFDVSDLGKLTIFDATGQQFNIPVYFDRVTVNGAIATSKEELGVWISQLMPEIN